MATATGQHTTPIPAAVIEQIPSCVASVPRPFDIRIQAFAGNDGEQMFSIDIYSNAEKITPADRRQKSYTQAMRTEFFFDADGGFEGAPTVVTTRYSG